MKIYRKIFCFVMFYTKLCLVQNYCILGLMKWIDLLDLVLFGAEKYDAIYNKIRYLTSQKSDVTYVIFHTYSKIKIDSYNSLPLEKYWRYIMLSYSIIQFLIKIKTVITIIYF